ncbi:MAG: hypothetical protein PHT31_00935 [Candidatus Omnitrophica bacterium]|nr:hypothetical protein [Candidatus Omnitrophota bacterium]MDD5652710.1 hypothetical protein [Candidatus Omnitrophota bacterium]
MKVFLFLLAGALAGFSIAILPAVSLVLGGCIVILLLIRNYFPAGGRKFILILFLFGFSLRALFATFYYFAALHTAKTQTTYGVDFQPDAGIYNNHALYLAHIINGIEVKDEILRDKRLDQDMEVSFAEFKGTNPPMRWYQYDDFVRLMAAFYSWIGYSPISVKLLNCLFGCLAAVAIYFFALKITESEFVAKASAFLVMFFPTMFLWSITGLKDAPTTLLFIILMYVIVWLVSSEGSLKKLWLLLLAMALAYLIDMIREKFAPALFFGIAIAFIFGIIKFCKEHKFFTRPVFALTSILLATVIILFLLSNQHFRHLINYSFYKFSSRQIASVTDLCSASVYKIFDNWVYTKAFLRPNELSALSLLIASIKGWVYLFLVPLPWQIDRASFFVLLPQQLFFYLSIPFIISGIWQALVKNFFPVLTILAVLVVIITPITLTEGVIGIAVRHRDMFTPFWLVFAAYGFYFHAIKNRINDNAKP